MLFTSLKRPNSCLPALSALRRCQTRFGTRKGSLNIATFAEYTRDSLHAESMLDLSCPAGMPQTQLLAFRADTTAEKCELFAACHDELMWRIEALAKSDSEESRVHRARLNGNAAKNQTARNQ